MFNRGCTYQFAVDLRTNYVLTSCCIASHVRVWVRYRNSVLCTLYLTLPSMLITYFWIRALRLFIFTSWRTTNWSWCIVKSLLSIWVGTWCVNLTCVIKFWSGWFICCHRLEVGSKAAFLFCYVLLWIKVDFNVFRNGLFIP